MPVAPLLWTRAKNTLLLNTAAMGLTWLVSVPMGVWVATRRRSAWDRAIDGANSILISIPEIVIAVALLAAVVHWRVLPIGGMTSLDHEGLSRWARIREVATRMLLPTIMLTLVEACIIVRHVRASVLEVVGAPFVQAGRGLGIGHLRLMFRHVLPAAANPIISLFGLSLAGLLSGSLLIETICGWPGLGPLILDATLSRDFYVVIGGIMLSTLFMMGGNLIADIMLLACDPRIRTEGADAF
jgi:peptide/nickel transport system permease protein